MKKKFGISIMFLLIIVGAILIGTGFIKRTDVMLMDYIVSEDGTTMNIKAQVASSMGFIRECQVKQGGDNQYITFYSTFGGLNSSIGAKSEFELELNSLCTEIYFYHGDGGYTLVLQKNQKTNEWERPQK